MLPFSPQMTSMRTGPSVSQRAAQATLSLELTRLGLKTHVLTKLDELVTEFWQNSDPRNLIQDAAHILNYNARVLRRLNVVLAAAEVAVSLAVVEEHPGLPSGPIFVVILREGIHGEVLRFPISPNPDYRYIYTTTDMLAPSLESENFGGQIQQLSSPLASCMMDLLLVELKRTTSPTRRRICNRSLRYLSNVHGVLPPSFLIYNVEKDGEFPVTCGGFADIYKGRLNTSTVCLKVLRYFSSATPTDRQKLIKLFCREALAWKQLHHPNILPFIGIAADLFRPSFCLVSPWMNNGNIVTFLDRNPTFDRLKAITEIAQAIKYLHEFDPPVIHADIRGANVLITDDLRCCLTDFGLTSVSETQVSSSFGSNGTLRWMAPEYLQPDAPQTSLPSRDIYAFGCTILEIYTGMPPFHYYRNDAIILHEVLDQRRPRRDSFIQDSIWSLIESCWRHIPEQRPSADDVLKTILSIALETASESDPTNQADTVVAMNQADGPAATSVVPRGTQSENSTPEGSQAHEPESPSSPPHPTHNFAKKLRRKLKYWESDILMPDPKDTDIVILVMGPIGCGKSTFINAAMGSTLMEVGPGLVLCTTELRHAVLPNQIESRRIVLLDTPGFDDNVDHNVDIMRCITVWLTQYYTQGRQEAAVIYLYDISQPTTSTSIRRNLELFQVLCGEDAVRRVILTPSKWNSVGESEGLRREEQVKKELGEGAGLGVIRFDGTEESARRLINAIAQSVEGPRRVRSSTPTDLRILTTSTTSSPRFAIPKRDQSEPPSVQKRRPLSLLPQFQNSERQKETPVLSRS